jgi:hypothetical protein
MQDQQRKRAVVIFAAFSDEERLGPFRGRFVVGGIVVTRLMPRSGSWWCRSRPASVSQRPRSSRRVEGWRQVTTLPPLWQGRA